MKIKYKTNYKGYLSILRGVQYLLNQGIINISQLGYYICFVSQADFDNKHPTYGVILRDDEELATEWNCDSSTIYRHRKKLIEKGLLEEKNGLTLVTNFHAFELEWVKIFAKLPPATLQSLFVKSQEEIVKDPNVIAEMQRNQTRNSIQSSNVSSKGALALSEKEWIDNTVVEDMNDNE